LPRTVADPGVAHEGAEPVQEIRAVLGERSGQALLERISTLRFGHGGGDGVAADVEIWRHLPVPRTGRRRTT